MDKGLIFFDAGKSGNYGAHQKVSAEVETEIRALLAAVRPEELPVLNLALYQVTPGQYGRTDLHLPGIVLHFDPEERPRILWAPWVQGRTVVLRPLWSGWESGTGKVPERVVEIPDVTIGELSQETCDTFDEELFRDCVLFRSEYRERLLAAIKRRTEEIVHLSEVLARLH